MFVETKEAGEVQQAPAKVLKLSEAVREGSKLRGECRGVWALNGKSCALVAACEATGLPYGSWLSSTPIYAHLLKLFPYIPRSVLGDIPVLMDNHGKTREQIADWLESQGL